MKKSLKWIPKALIGTKIKQLAKNWLEDISSYDFVKDLIKDLSGRSTSTLHAILDLKDIGIISSSENVKDSQGNTYNIGVMPTAIDSPQSYLNKYLSLLNGKRVKGTFTGTRSSYTKPLANYMESLGVDTSYFTEADLRHLIQLRNESMKQFPKGRSATYLKFGELFDTQIYDNGTYIGHVGSSPTNDLMKVSYLSKDNKAFKGFSKSAYDALIKLSKQHGYSGIMTGELLLSPEQTYKVWESYPDKLLIGNFGSHSFNYGFDVVRNGDMRFIQNGPVYKISTPTSDIPLKDASVFHPDMIDNGKLKFPDWSDPNIYKSLIPIGLYGLYPRNNASDILER